MLALIPEQSAFTKTSSAPGSRTKRSGTLTCRGPVNILVAVFVKVKTSPLSFVTYPLWPILCDLSSAARQRSSAQGSGLTGSASKQVHHVIFSRRLRRPAGGAGGIFATPDGVARVARAL